MSEHIQNSDVSQWVDRLSEEELRKVLSLGYAKLRDQSASPVGKLLLRNMGEIPLRIRAHGEVAEKLAAGETHAFVPEPFSVYQGEPGAAGNRWLTPRARTVLCLEIAAGTGEARCRLELGGWRADCARLGAPELIALAHMKDEGGEVPKTMVSYLPVVDLTIPEGGSVQVIILGRGPEDDTGRLVRRLFAEPAEQAGTAGLEEESGEGDETDSQGETL